MFGVQYNTVQSESVLKLVCSEQQLLQREQRTEEQNLTYIRPVILINGHVAGKDCASLASYVQKKEHQFFLFFFFHGHVGNSSSCKKEA